MSRSRVEIGNTGAGDEFSRSMVYEPKTGDGRLSWGVEMAVGYFG